MIVGASPLSCREENSVRPKTSTSSSSNGDKQRNSFAFSTASTTTTVRQDDKENYSDTPRPSFETVAILVRQSVSPLSHFTPTNIRESPSLKSRQRHHVSTPSLKGTANHEFKATPLANDMATYGDDEVGWEHDGGSTGTMTQESKPSPWTSDGAKEKEAGAVSHFLSPCDSDSFDWRDEISPLVTKKYKSKRRSSFAFRPKSNLGLQSLSPFRSPNRPPASGVPEAVTTKTAKGFTVEREAIAWCEPASKAAFLASSSPEVPPQTKQPALPVSFVDSNGRAPTYYLAPISEISSEMGEGTTCKVLAEENKMLRKRLEFKSTSYRYDHSVGPFRNVLETLPKLRSENETLKEQNAKLQKEKAEIESSVNGTIQELQLQMSSAMQLAVDKTTSLQNELQSLRNRNEQLEKQLSGETTQSTDAADK